MKRRSRTVAAVLLILVAIALVLGVVTLYSWAGRVEALLLVFGDRVWVTVEAGRPRVLLLMTLPGVLLWAAFSLFLRRPGE